jgi:paraquat-inducible protein B
MTLQEKITYYQAHKQYNPNSLYGKYITEYKKQCKLHKQAKTKPELKAQLKEVNLYNSPKEYYNIIKTAKHFRTNLYYKKSIQLTEEASIYAITRILTITQLIRLEASRQKYIDQKQNTKLIQHNQSQIIVPKLQNPTDQQVEQIATKLQQLEEQYYLQLDTDYNSKQSIIRNYQQYLYYIKYNIELQPRDNTILVGNTELLEKGAIQC